MEEIHSHLLENIIQPSLIDEPNLNLGKRKRRYQSVKELLNIRETPWILPNKGVLYKKHIKPTSCKLKRISKRHLHGKVEVKSPVMDRAHAVQANLDSRFPSFTKLMIRSNVTHGFWLSLPNLFCKMHLPRHDTLITLMDENQKVHNIKYLAERTGLSGGWRGFSLAHNLEEGDAVVFHLVGVCILRVYIVRANHLGEVDAALSLLHLDAEATSVDHEPPSQDSRLLTEGNKKQPHPCQQEHHLEQNFVKENIYEDLSLHLEVLISEIISIADAVKGNKIVVSTNNFSSLEKRTTSLEHMHDGLGWVRSRLDTIVFRMLESSKNGCSLGRGGVGQRWDHSEEMRTFKRKMLELKDATERLTAEVEVLKIKAEIDA